MFISERELWACANHLLASRGPEAQEHVSAQINELEATGDEAGIKTWQAISLRIAFLAAGEHAPGTRH